MSESIIDLNDVIYKKGLLKSIKISQVELRDFKAKDLYDLDFNEASKVNENMAILISRLSGLDKELVDELSLNDFMKISERINKLFNESQY